jgi:hypothetical protein
MGPKKDVFRAPEGGGQYWYSVRDTCDVLTNLSPAQPSTQVIPKELSINSPITARLLFNGEEVLNASACEWSYMDSKHQCYLRFTPDFSLDCAELVKHRRVPFMKYWRDTSEERYVSMMIFEEEFFTPERVDRLKELSLIIQ